MYLGWNISLPQLQGFDDDSLETRSLSTFGRGAQGRLGYGSNRGRSTPALVSKWPPSLTIKGPVVHRFCYLRWYTHSMYANLPQA